MKTIQSIILLLFSTFLINAQDVSITDYKVPISQARAMNISLDYNRAGIGDSTIADNGTANLVYKHFYSSLPFSWSFDFDGTGVRQNDDFQSAFVATTSANKYFSNEKDFFGFGQLQGSYAEGNDQVQSRVAAGLGYGRFISATAFAKAIRIDNFLLDEGVISAHLDKETLIEIGNIIEREDEYRDNYGATYEPQWYNDIEKAVRQSGNLKGEGLGAIGILRVKEVLFFENIQDRFYGWDVRAGIAYDITTPDKSDGEPSVQLGVSGAYPIALKAQLSHSTTYNSFFDSFGETFSVISNTNYTYELSNRIDWLLGYQLQSFKVNPDLDAINTNVLRTSFIFFIENNINLVANGQLDKTGDADWNNSITFTIGYRIL